MKIALIAGGMDDIPSKKFGAIEMILWNYKRDLESMGHEVLIFNTKNLHEVARKINSGNFDFVELNYSEYVHFFLRHLRVPFCTVCHSGYITNRKKWSIGYNSVFYDTMKCAGVIALSDDIKNLYLKNGYKGFIRVVRNGIDTDNFVPRENGNGRAVCLGRIEPRKRQTWLARLVSDKVDLDFVGPIQDDTFKAEGRTRHMGYWMKHQVYENLSQYSCLALLSDGEAAPLVVPEALAAGLSVVVTRSAAANLDGQLPFVTVLPDDTNDSEVIAHAINTQIENNNRYRPQIVSYARSYFDSKAVAADFITVIEEFKKIDHTNIQKTAVPLSKLPIYVLSRLALKVKSVIRQ
jgi:glycosyltransferase involved in cell wall biosynthesis